MKDLTKGRPSVLILTFALPIFLANLLQLTYSLADTRIVGTFLGDNALAAVGATTTLSNLIVQFLMGMCNGFAIISAQCFGAKDMDRLRRSLGNSLVLGLLAAVVLTIGGLVFLQPILRFLNVPENLLNTATQYVSVIIAGLVITLLYDVLAATLRAIGDTVTPLIVLAVSVVLNIGGDLLLIVVLHMGVLGAAVATVLSQLIAVVVCAVYLWEKYEILRIRVDDLKLKDAGMLRNIPLMLDITREVVKAVNVPVTVKTRLGWDCENLIITDLAEQLQDCGIQALTIHGRTRSQMYTGEADWSLIGEVKNNPRIHIPIIGNGDITTPEEAKLAFERYGVDAVMIGRATFGRPWIFKEIRDYLDNTGATPLTVDEKIDLLEEQLRINVERIDEYRGILHTRRHLAASPIFKGIPDFRQTRIAMLRATTVEELTGILKECRERIKAIE